MSLENFKFDCLNLESQDVVQKYLLDGDAYFFSRDEKHNEYVFKKDIANSLGAHLRDIVIVGSGKLGFSIKPEIEHPGLWKFKQFDSNDGKLSDLDIAIVSNKIFDDQLIKLYTFTSSYINDEVWKQKSDRRSMAKYILKGWLRPDFIPKDYLFSEGVNDVRAEYKKTFGRDINIGIYKSWFFFEKYHERNIKNIYLNQIANG